MKSKVISVLVSKYVNPETYEHGQMLPVASVQIHTAKPFSGYIDGLIAVIEAATGEKSESDDREQLESLWMHKKSAFKYGPNWEFYIDVAVIDAEA